MPRELSEISPMFCNEALFWETLEPLHEMVYFDIHDEKFQVIQLPDEYVSNKDYYGFHPELMEYNGCLCFGIWEYSRTTHNRYRVRLHILKEKIKQVWMQETVDFILPFTLPSECYCNIMGFSDRAIICWLDKECFRIYDVQSKDLKEVQHRGGDCGEEFQEELFKLFKQGQSISNLKSRN
ncbi:F-box associated domain [Macleaya cordata]|uniref:F-box associated domain n=1 Tax=Macleaya cordata TaxID=56857 RepID=A0A200PPB6_MACCD|nr:F-box associated domain [Macleaya cordata]